MRVAIVHDWLNGMRGGEKVLEGLLELFPQATIYTLFHESGTVSPLIQSRNIVTSWLNRIPGIYRHYRNLLPLFPAACESMDLSQFDLVISSSHAVAKGIRAPHAKHICYCHTPMRYIWDAENDYRFSAVRRIGIRSVRRGLRKWDRETAGRVDYFIANSQFVRRRIQTCYGRDAAVINPPVDTKFFTPSSNPSKDFYLSAGALVPYKRVDLIIEAFKHLDYRLVIAGGGPELKRLRKLATSNIDVRGWVSNDELRQLYRNAKALIVAAREDFGIVTVEAQACGCPVIAYRGGGSIEIIQEGINGTFFSEQRADHIVRAVRRFELRQWPAEQVRSLVEGFSRETFQSKIGKVIATQTGYRPGAPVTTAQAASVR